MSIRAGFRIPTGAQLRRWVRIVRLSARRGGGWVVTRARGRTRTAAERAALDEQFAIRSAQDVAAELGNMKGAAMKLGQMMSYQVAGLPPAARKALATLQSDVEPMAPSLAESVIRKELGRHPRQLFLEWNPVPVAAASIGQVHRATLRDGREVAVKVQYPGVAKAIEADLANTRWIHRMLSVVALRNLDIDALVGELKERMTEELDYGLEAQRQQRFADRYRDHPFIRIPQVIGEFSGTRVLTTEWASGETWSSFTDRATQTEKQWLAEALFRFTQGGLYRFEEFHGDPHPGNFLIDPRGWLEVLDFGMVKTWSPGETDALWALIDPVLADDQDAAIARMIDAGFLAADHGLDPARVWEWVKAPYVPYQSDSWSYPPNFTGSTLGTMLDPRGSHADVMNSVTMPASFVVLDRVVWGLSALLSELGATNAWRLMLAEYRSGAGPVTEMGRREADWAATR